MSNYFSLNPTANYEKALSGTMSKVYLYMSLGMLITAASAYFTYSSPAMLAVVYGTPLWLVLLLAEVILVFVFSIRLQKMSVGASAACLLVYSVLNGITLSAIFMMYELGSVATIFLVTCLMFGGMSLFGYVTKLNLAGVGYICIMALWGVIIAGIVNLLIFRSSMMDFGLSCLGVAIFVLLTAYDTQKIKKWLSEAQTEEQVKKISLLGSLQLYLDFINIFIRLLSLMGKRK